jgi:hypothetical protein
LASRPSEGSDFRSVTRRAGHAHRRGDAAAGTIAAVARERVIANRGAEACRDLIALVAGSADEEDEHLVRRRVSHNVAAPKVAPNELDHLLAERGGMSVVRTSGGTGWTGSVHLHGEHGRRSAPTDRGGDSRSRNAGEFICRRG